jgi:hypothetical protein
MVAVVWDKSKKGYRLPSNIKQPKKSDEDAAARILLQQTGVYTREAQEPMQELHETGIFLMKTTNSKDVALQTQSEAKGGKQWARWVPRSSFVDAHEPRGAKEDKHWIPVATRASADALAQIAAQDGESFPVDLATSLLIRTVTTETAMELSAWEEILRIKTEEVRAKGEAIHFLYDWETGIADMISVFDGPSGQLNRMCEDAGVHAMPAIDKVAKIPYDILDDIQFSSLMVGVLKQKPGLLLLAPECTSFSKAQDFNKNRPDVMSAIAKERKVQTRFMARVNAILRATWTYGAEAIVENPWHSYFWKQDFCSRMKDDLPSGRKWCDIKLNMCMVGSKHFKPLRFRTTLPPKVTTAMEL